MKELTTARISMLSMMEDFERFSGMAVGREEKMIQLREEINEFLIRSGRDEKYKIVSAEG